MSGFPQREIVTIKDFQHVFSCPRIEGSFFVKENLHNNITTIDHRHDDFAWDRTTYDAIEEVIL